jgi:CRP/FNR family transcriptional regulator, dissimilatory nitrate respiration regulator
MEQPILPPSLKTLLPQEVHPHCIGRHYKKNERLFKTGVSPEWMFYVVSGEVTLERIGLQGEAVVLQRTRTGFVSEASLKVARYHCDAVAVSATLAIKVPIAQLVHFLDQDSQFAIRWIDMLNNEVRRLRMHCERLSMKSVKDRLLHLIQTEGKDGHYAVASGLKTLAGELGVTHEALYRTMADVQKSGLLSKVDGELIIQKQRS